jgi:hypothetical protein
LIDDEFCGEFIETLGVHVKDEVVEIATAEKRFENDY